MKHDWDVTHKPVKGEGRRCKNCAAVQTYRVKYEWGRPVYRGWTPRLGKCKAQPARPTPAEAGLETGA